MGQEGSETGHENELVSTGAVHLFNLFLKAPKPPVPGGEDPLLSEYEDASQTPSSTSPSDRLTRRNTTANSPISTSDRVSARGSRAACSRSEDMVGLRYRGGESSNPLETCRDVGGGVLFGLATEGNISRGDGVDGRVLLVDDSANDDAIGCGACAVGVLYDPKFGFERS